MKKKVTAKTLTLKKETIINLETRELGNIRGGSQGECPCDNPFATMFLGGCPIWI